jgi:hypothetical protein
LLEKLIPSEVKLCESDFEEYQQHEKQANGGERKTLFTTRDTVRDWHQAPVIEVL